MNINRLNFLKEHLHLLDVDLENGIIKNRSCYMTHEGRLHLKLKSKWYAVHEVIAVAGGLDILNLTVNHKDFDKLNNRLDNLEPATILEQQEHSQPFRQRKSKYDVDLIKSEYASGLTIMQISAKHGIPKSTVGRLIK